MQLLTELSMAEIFHVFSLSICDTEPGMLKFTEKAKFTSLNLYGSSMLMLRIRLCEGLIYGYGQY